MHWILYAAIFVLTFIIMEGITWLTHKYIMHGSFWFLHRDHHLPETKGFFEKNDGFFLIFAIPCFLCILYGTTSHRYWLQSLGFGVMAYGLAYFLVHDIIIHQRFKWFTHSDNTYIKAIRWAHKMHHKHTAKEDGESFGFLFVPKRYLEKVRRDKQRSTAA